MLVTGFDGANHSRGRDLKTPSILPVLVVQELSLVSLVGGPGSEFLMDSLELQA